MAESVSKTHFEVGVYRPPSEGGSDSLLLRLTRNCPWNRCTFCGMYKGKKFQVRSPAEIRGDIDAIAHICSRLQSISHQQGSGGGVTRKAVMALLDAVPEYQFHHGFSMVYNWLRSGGRTAFLQDANSLIMRTADLVAVLEYLRKTFPSIERVTTYARSRTLVQKSPDALEAIRRAGLDRLHVGLETGDDELLKRIKKGVSSDGHIAGGRRALAAGFELSEYWMPGLGGREMWENHARNTARVLNEINPHYIRSRPVFPAPGTPLHDRYESGDFQMLTPRQQLGELQRTIEALHVTARVCFDHAGNYWRNRRGGLLFSQRYEGYRFPEEKPAVLKLIEEGLSVG